MRRFHSYGPVDCEEHFCVPRTGLVQECLEQLIGHPDKGGHYFTIWAPRQTGKTWLMRQVQKRLETEYEGQFLVGSMSMQGVVIKDDDPSEAFFECVPRLFEDHLGLQVAKPATWAEWKDLFSKNRGVVDRPTILFIDEFDSLPFQVIDQLVTLFRDMYLNRGHYLLHGLALIGVRAVLGVGSERGSPFNVQRSLHVPNLTREEVTDLFRQYEQESGQEVADEVVEAMYTNTRGQPGLVGWFGELLTEKYNPGPGKSIGQQAWKHTHHAALHLEWNNTVLNLVKKAKGAYQDKVAELFGNSELEFSIDEDWCNYLYLNGIIDSVTITDANGLLRSYCIFSCPFVQRRLFNAFSSEVFDPKSALVLHPLDDLADVFAGETLNLPALLQRYRDYLQRLEDKGLSPWQGQPRRSDLHLTEAVGHFHLYAWLRQAVGRLCVVSPEFPTGNGKVDICIICKEKKGIVEVKSFVDRSTLEVSLGQAADYASSLGLLEVTLAVFVPTREQEILDKLSGEREIEQVVVQVMAIGWG
ncbi:MAG: AAA-like domain-containing protein [Desulfovermiculus sp.]|nr:AAA-like domain-containing protein [Desulfovermiculus sp.]